MGKPGHSFRHTRKRGPQFNGRTLDGTDSGGSVVLMKEGKQ